MFGANGLDTKSSRAGLSASHFMIWASSAIVVGITGYFLSKYNHDGHLIYQMVIVCVLLVDIVTLANRISVCPHPRPVAPFHVPALHEELPPILHAPEPHLLLPVSPFKYLFV
jgi:hypothetical protein